MNNFTQFRVRYSSRLSIDDQNLFYIRMVQALEQDTFPHHARCSGYDCFNFHEFYVDTESYQVCPTQIPAGTAKCALTHYTRIGIMWYVL